MIINAEYSKFSITIDKIRLAPFVFLYKLLLEVSFWKVLTVDYPFFEFSFDLLKYLNGFIWCMICYVFLEVRRKKASSFFTLLIFVLQIIPITVVYALTPVTSPIYYNLLLFTFLMCEIIVGTIDTSRVFKPNADLSRAIVPVFALVSVGMLLLLIAKNGMPSLGALDIYSVYDLRADNDLGIGEYLGRVLSLSVTVFLPVLFSKAAIEKKYAKSIACMLAIFIIYLYTGHKVYLFSIPLCVAAVIWSKKDDCIVSFFRTMLLAFSALCLLTMLWPGKNNIMSHIYSLFVRRVLIVPAVLKFYHYDYFTTHPYLGLYGAIPLAINPYIPQYYVGMNYQMEIGEIYFHVQSNANTGFLVEGFARFGYIGLILSGVLLAWILKLFDSFQKRTNYQYAICFFLYTVYALADRQIVGTLFFGVWFFALVVVYHYSGRRSTVRSFPETC